MGLPKPNVPFHNIHQLQNSYDDPQLATSSPIAYLLRCGLCTCQLRGQLKGIWLHCSNGETSVRLRDGLHELAANLQILSISLDAVVFRNVWRAVAVAAMRLLFNDIATEAWFSPEVGLPS
jgi:hypothetical protein